MKIKIELSKFTSWHNYCFISNIHMKLHLIATVLILSLVSCEKEDTPQYPLFRADVIGIGSFDGTISHYDNSPDSLGNTGLTIQAIDGNSHDTIVIILGSKTDKEEYINLGSIRCSGYFSHGTRSNFVGGGVLFEGAPWLTGNFSFKTADSIDIIDGYFKLHL